MMCRTCDAVCWGGGAFAAILVLCALGAGPALALVSVLGMTFALQSAILVPVLIVALAVTGWGLWLGFRSHGRAEPLMVGLAGSLATVIGLLVSGPIAVMGIVAVLGAAVWSTLVLHAQPETSEV